jgi:hypothetical protein
MSVVLRHKKLPFIMVYSDPKKSWDSVSKEVLIEEIKKDGFDSFVEESSVPPLFHRLFVPIVEEDKESNVRQKHTDSLGVLHEEEGTYSVEEEDEYNREIGD